MFSPAKAISITLLGFGASCSSSVFTDYPEDAWFALDAFEHGEFQSAAQEFQLLNGTLDSNEFLAYAESGMAYHVGGDLEAATNEWLKAVRVLDDFGDRPTISGRSLSEGALSMLINDKTIPYDGEGFEAVLLHGFLAWDFLRLNKLDDALVEVKRGYEFELFEEERFGTTYGMNRFARFVAALAQDIDGQYDDARIDLESLAKEIPDHPTVQYSLARIERLQSRERAAEREVAEIVVVFERGRMPQKVAHELRYSTNRSIGKFSVPDFGMPAFAAASVSVKVGDRGLGTTTLIEDVLAVGKSNLNDRIGWATTKSVARSVAKTVIVDEVSEAAKEKHGKWAGILVGITGTLLNEYTERADLRSWLTLPTEIQVLRAAVTAGKHRVILTSGSAGQKLDLGIHSFQAGKPVLIGVREIGGRLYAEPNAHGETRP
ncbi:MAG: hypothetical protein QF489_00560 [Planctomycetota bacterium]|jgi:hypothetical protein|nr:hypothetical protein [Planctomycetota bacterium]